MGDATGVAWRRFKFIQGAPSGTVVGTLLFGLSLLVTLAFSSAARADVPPSNQPTFQDVLEAERLPVTQPTNQQAAEELPLEDLGRSEALELLSSVFGEQLAAPASLFGDLEVESFLSNYVAVVESNGQPGLFDSSLPLRTPDPLGRSEQVDLSLEHAEGEIQPANPLAETGIPDQLGEGIELPDAAIQIELAGAPADRTASIVEGAAAVYPNVAQDTDFAVAPTPTGVETLTQVRSPQAPLTQTLELSMPDGASLEERSGGGAEVTSNGQTLITVAPATAIDATGAPVDVSLEVSDDSLTYTVEPGPETAYPILLDPLIQEYVWGSGTYTNIADWKAEQSPTPFVLATSAACSTWCAGYLAANSPGLWVAAWDSSYDAPNYQGGFYYYVPRWQSDWTTYNESPKSFIKRAAYYAISFQHRSDSNASPYLYTALWSPEKAQAQGPWSHGGNEANLTLGASEVSMPGTNMSKEAIFALVSSDYHVLTARRDAWLGWATLELSDEDHPKPQETALTEKWVNNSPASPLSFKFFDRGLGVYSITVKDKSGHSWKTQEGCVGVASSPCPRYWGSTIAGQPQLTYDPSVLPTGVDDVELVASDPLGQTNLESLPETKTIEAVPGKIKVDHAKPTLEPLTGTIAEQGTLGTMLPTYKVKYLAKDGTEAAPQSGAAAIEIKVDGAKAFSTSPGCPAKNCELPGEWTLESSKYANGTHTLEVIAKDGVGLESEPRKQTFTIAHDESAPQLAFSGTATEQAGLGTTLPRYGFTLKATDPTGANHSGVASETIEVDGKAIDTYAPGCGAAGNCSIERGLTLAASGYTEGAHTLKATATDSAGNKATKTLAFRFDKDTTAPLIAFSNTLAQAPAGWVEQHNYILTATATDVGGYGGKQIIIKLDGQQIGQTFALACEWGGCERTKTQLVEAAKYTGGAHELQVIASDNAGNQRTKVFTMNVDPVGNISAEESTETLEAVAETSPVNPVGESEEEEAFEGTAPGLTFEEGEDGIEAAGTATPVTITEEGPCAIEMQSLPEGAFGETTESEEEDPPVGEDEEAPIGEGEDQEAEAGAEVELSPEGEPVELAPNEQGNKPCQPVVKNDAAAVEPNTAPGVDTITRPLYDGSMIFEGIRGPEAPEEYSWEFNLHEEEELKVIDEDSVGIFWPNDSLAMAIGATPATDAAGKAVPTTLSVSEGNVVTLTVHYKAGNYAYPILAGTAMQVGYEEATAYFPPGTEESGEFEGEESGQHEFEIEVGRLSWSTFGAPMPISASGTVTDRPYSFHECRWDPSFNEEGSSKNGYDPEEIRHIATVCRGQLIGKEGAEFALRWALSVHGHFSYKPGFEVWIESAPSCSLWWGKALEKVAPEKKGCWAPHWWSRDGLDLIGRVRFKPSTMMPGRAPLDPFCAELDGVIPKNPIAPPKESWLYGRNWHWYTLPLEHTSDECPWGHLNKVH